MNEQLKLVVSSSLILGELAAGGVQTSQWHKPRLCGQQEKIPIGNGERGQKT
jgi:hypothetical protein